MLTPIPLERWSVCDDPRDSPYQPPSCRCLQGYIPANAHPRHPKQGFVLTSPIANVEGRIIRTASGTLYELTGDPVPEYLEWLRSNGYVYDPDEPIGILPGSRKAARC